MFAIEAQTQLESRPGFPDGNQDDVQHARAMALVIHELITNAAKYGALAAPNGRVRVRWQADGKAVAIDWSEAGGPPVRTPADYGFGSRLVVRTLQALSGSVEPQFDPAGLKCRISFRV